MSGRFIDKTKFKLQCKTNLRTRVKRNIRGKIKYKTKPKGNSIILSVIPSMSIGSRLTDLPGLNLDGLQMPIENCDLKRFVIDDKRIVIGVKDHNDLKYTELYDGQSIDDINTNTNEIIMKLFLSAFNIINLNKKLSDQSP